MRYAIQTLKQQRVEILSKVINENPPEEEVKVYDGMLKELSKAISTLEYIEGIR